MVLVLPPEGKDLAQFQQEETVCRGYANQQLGYGASQRVANESKIPESALGAASPGAVAANAGAARPGETDGAGAGLLTGSAMDPGNATATEVQQRYDFAYAQCMVASGNHVQPLALALLSAPFAYPRFYYGPWFDPLVGFGFFGAFWPRFHHHHAFFDHRSRHG
jgi:hypothetical protein